eukprot:928068_1
MFFRLSFVHPTFVKDEMWVILCLLCHVLLFEIVYGGIPVSIPGIGHNKQYPMVVPYNLIDTNASCYHRGLCPELFKPGGRLGSFPNSEEKYQMLLQNLFRMWGNDTRDLKWAKYKWGANTNAGLTYYCSDDSCKYCGDTSPRMMPLYWYSDANQAARFKQYDENVCDQDWYKEPGQSAHSTCDWVLPDYKSDCDQFGDDCSMYARSIAFGTEDGVWFSQENICGGSTCVSDAHCEPIFATSNDFIGSGFVEGMNGAAHTYARSGKTISYLLPMAAHFDERTKVAKADRNDNRKWFTFMLQYFDANHTQTPVGCWVIYHKGYHEMGVVVSEVGSQGSGFSMDSHSVMFTSYHLPQSKCRPYAFICKTSLNNWVRLPEDGDYYFGTAFMDWDDGNGWNTNYADLQPREDWIAYTCKENHYYWDGTQWIVNGGPGLDRCDIWHYQDTETLRSGTYDERTTCNGCSDFDRLDCWSECVYSDFVEEHCQCSDVPLGPKYGNEWCDPADSPTKRPTGDSEAPTPSPTPAPSAPSQSPIRHPSQSPTVRPSRSPLPPGVTYPPTAEPSPSPTKAPSPPTARGVVFYGDEPTAATTPVPIDTTDQGSEDESQPKPHAGGGGAALFVIILIVVFGVVAWVYWRKHGDKTLLPSLKEMTSLPRQLSQHISNRQTKPQPVSGTHLGPPPGPQQMGKRGKVPSFSADPNTLAVGTLGAPVKSYSAAGDSADEGEAPIEPYTVPDVESGKTSPAVGRTGQPPLKEQLSSNALKMADRHSNSSNSSNSSSSLDGQGFVSIEQAKEMKGTDKEKYLNDDDFLSVFEMTKDEFKKLAPWKKKAAKIKAGLF